MPAQLVSYDLIKRKDYPELFKALEVYSPRLRCLKSAWILITQKTAEQVRDQLRHHIDNDDKLLVATLTGVAAWAGLPKEAGDWLRNNLK